jgi:hypothetical protein
MITTDKNALICDLAETYGIFNYRALPVDTLAVLSVGLRENSRIKMKLSGANVAPDFLLLAKAVDLLALLFWSKTEDAQKGANRPKSIVEMLTRVEKESDVLSFETAEDFNAEWQRITKGVE